jgi:hypothetical protein
MTLASCTLRASSVRYPQVRRYSAIEVRTSTSLSTRRTVSDPRADAFERVSALVITGITGVNALRFQVIEINYRLRTDSISRITAS